MYEPKEDSFLLQKYVKKYAKGSVLDLGTGSGIQAITALKTAKKVTASDINEKLIDKLQKKYPKINFIYSDLFKNIKEKYDLIIFNPPYLPQDKNIKDRTIYGGKKGYEIIERFLTQVKGYLKPNGKILLIFSSLTNKKKIDGLIKQNNLNFKLLEEKRIFFEVLYVYLIKQNPNT